MLSLEFVYLLISLLVLSKVQANEGHRSFHLKTVYSDVDCSLIESGKAKLLESKYDLDQEMPKCVWDQQSQGFIIETYHTFVGNKLPLFDLPSDNIYVYNMEFSPGKIPCDESLLREITIFPLKDRVCDPVFGFLHTSNVVMDIDGDLALIRKDYICESTAVCTENCIEYLTLADKLDTCDDGERMITYRRYD